MNNRRPLLVFIHGLNTYGDDELHIGPWKRGQMHRHVQDAFGQLGIETLCLTELGNGAPEKQAEIAAEELNRLGAITQRAYGICLFGHSTGGLVARVLAARKELDCRRIITIGTPHLGTHSAQFGMEFADRHPMLCRAFSKFGYDTREKARLYEPFTVEAMADFNQRYPARDRVPEISMVCEVPAKALSWPLLPLYRQLHPLAADDVAGTRPASDGLVWSTSQRRGELRGPYALDHFGQLGFFPSPNPTARRRGLREFRRMIAEVASLVSK